MVDTESEFQNALDALILEAEANEVEVIGGWDVRDPDAGNAGWTVEITEFEI